MFRIECSPVVFNKYNFVISYYLATICKLRLIVHSSGYSLHSTKFKQTQRPSGILKVLISSLYRAVKIIY